MFESRRGICLIGTCDTKLEELLYTRKLLEKDESVKVTLIDVGRTSSKDPSVDHRLADLIATGEVKTSFDSASLASASRGDIINAMTEGCTILINNEFQKGNLHGAIALGGSGGTSIAASVMREALPIGFPKLIVSTVASGDTSSYIGESDITLMPSIVDIAGLNDVLRAVLGNATAAITVMSKSYFKRKLEKSNLSRAHDIAVKKRVAITMFGVTTPAATIAREYLTERNCEVFTFHATGTGGRAMERLIGEGQIDAVLDLTTTELADELVGGVMSAGPERLRAAARRGIPQIVSVGALDMVNFGPLSSIPEKFKNRKLYEHNPNVTLMRTSPEECRKLAEMIFSRLQEYCKDRSVVEVWIPLKGVSMISSKGSPFHDEIADTELSTSISSLLRSSDIRYCEKQMEINDPEFATGIAQRLLELMGV